MQTFKLLALLLVHSASASTSPIFSQDGKMATVLMAGLGGDPDAFALWNALKMPPEDFQGKLSKRLSFAGPDGAKGFDIACVFSKMIQNNGTCTVIFRDVPGLMIVSRQEGRAHLWLTGEKAVQFSEAFAMRDESSIIFRSENGRLNFSVARDRGVITDFVVDWK